MRLSVLFIILIGAGLSACSSFSPISYSSHQLEIDSAQIEIGELNKQIRPFRDSLALEMNKVIGFTTKSMIKGRPCSELNNWVADALLRDQDSLYQLLKPAMSLLNVGGLRSSLNAGEITKGDVFSLMPFENNIVWVKLPISCKKEIEDYLRKTGGEPIGGAEFTKEGLLIKGLKENDFFFWVVTNDYLMNGGDKMTFFEKKLDIIYPNKLLRDVFMDEIKSQGTLVIDKKCRIDVEK